MTLAVGFRLGPYEIAGLLGAGGMGEVYKARDTRLDRVVAIKVLPRRFANQPELRSRFEREARAISSLQHPNICALFDVGRQGEIDYLVMEFVDGESLAKRIAKGPLPIDLVLRSGREIAEALDTAHRQGIVHRDLKPGNVMMTKSGAKLLDFGLAKLRAGSTGSFSRSAMENLATAAEADASLTREGAVLGTFQYMPPEQLEGRETDARVDLWALGCVLYEMTTGRAAFAGVSHPERYAAILGAEPVPIAALRPDAPPALARLVATCLAKDPDLRWQSARDVALQLHGPGAGEPEMQRSARSVRPKRRWILLGAAALFVAAIAGEGWLKREETGRLVPSEVRFLIAPPDGGRFAESPERLAMAVSPDGRTLAFAIAETGGSSRIWLRPISEERAHPLAGTEGANSPFWSPDGSSVAFFGQGKLRRIELVGGAPVTICDVPPGIGLSGTWGTEGDILFASVQGQFISRVSASGGVPEIVLRPEAARGELRTFWPQYLPDGRSYLYLGRKENLEATLMLVEPNKPPRPVATLLSRFEFLSPSLLAFAKEGVLVGQRWDPAARRLLGAPFSIAPAVRYFASTGAASFAVSPARTVVVQNRSDEGRVVWLNRSGKLERSSTAIGDYLHVRISPDGRKLLVERARAGLGTYALWIQDIDRNTEEPVTFKPDSEFAGMWLPDGKSFVYSTVLGAAPQMILREMPGGGERVLAPRPAFQEGTDISRDGRYLAYVERGETGRFKAWILSLDGEPAPRPLFPTDGGSSEIRFSPDGRYIAWLADDTGRSEAYFAALASPSERTRVSKDGAVHLRWSRDGNELFYLSADSRMISVPLLTGPRLELGAPTTLFALPDGATWLDFDVSLDGRRFVAAVRDVSGNAQPLSVIVGWQAPIQ